MTLCQIFPVSSLLQLILTNYSGLRDRISRRMFKVSVVVDDIAPVRTYARHYLYTLSKISLFMICITLGVRRIQSTFSKKAALCLCNFVLYLRFPSKSSPSKSSIKCNNNNFQKIAEFFPKIFFG